MCDCDRRRCRSQRFEPPPEAAEAGRWVYYGILALWLATALFAAVMLLFFGDRGGEGAGAAAGHENTNRIGGTFMSGISEARLPGVGRKFQVEAASGDRLTVIVHDDGRRELYHFSREDPDRVTSVVRLLDGEARQVAGIIGGLTYVPRALPSAELVLEDLVLEWFTVPPGAACAGKTIRDLMVRTRTGASIVSILCEGGQSVINPEADTRLAQGATLIVAGDRKTIAALKQLLIDGSSG